MVQAVGIGPTSTLLVRQPFSPENYARVWPTRSRRRDDLAGFSRALYVLSYWSVNRIW